MQSSNSSHLFEQKFHFFDIYTRQVGRRKEGNRNALGLVVVDHTWGPKDIHCNGSFVDPDLSNLSTSTPHPHPHLTHRYHSITLVVAIDIHTGI